LTGRKADDTMQYGTKRLPKKDRENFKKVRNAEDAGLREVCPIYESAVKRRCDLLRSLKRKEEK
jgi:hypothetical protein